MGGKISDIYVETFVNATEVESYVREAVAKILGEEIELECQVVEGSFGNPLIILRARISRKKEVQRIMARLSKSDFFLLSLQRADERLDENGVYHLRIDKGSAYRGDPRLWEGGEGVEIRLKVTTYPFSYSEALKSVRELGGNSGER